MTIATITSPSLTAGSEDTVRRTSCFWRNTGLWPPETEDADDVDEGDGGELEPIGEVFGGGSDKQALKAIRPLPGNDITGVASVNIPLL